MAGYLSQEWDLPVTIDAIGGERDLFGDGRIVLIPLPGHTPGTTGALVALESSGMFLLASDTVSLRATLDSDIVPRNTWNAEALKKSLAEVDRIEKSGARLSAATTPRNGRRCARGPTPMTDGAEIHARPKIVGARVKRTEDPRLLDRHRRICRRPPRAARPARRVPPQRAFARAHHGNRLRRGTQSRRASSRCSPRKISLRRWRRWWRRRA